MRPLKRAFTGIGLFLCLLAPLVTGLLLLQHQKHMVRKTVKRQIIAGLSADELTAIKIHKKDIYTLLEWEHSKEFEYQHQMYDVVFTDTLGDSILYHCWWDYEETSLNRQLHHLATNAWNHNPVKEQKQKELKQLFKNWLPSYFSSQLEAFYTLPHIKYPHFNTNPSRIYLPPQSPPPQWV